MTAIQARGAIQVRGAASADEIAAVLTVLCGGEQQAASRDGITAWRDRRRAALAVPNPTSRPTEAP